jgi:signal transduction histidine kinase
MGRAWAARGAQAEALRERARHLEDERELEAARERARISRDVHDILGHGVSVMIAQAEAGPVFIGRDNARVEATFDAITAAGREAMSQLRRILDVLGDRSEHPAPRPTLSDLASLAAQVTASGVRVELVESTPAGTLSADAQVAAYRIAQEALTNTLKHARGVPEPVEAHVDLDWSDGSMAMTITDNGSGGTVGNSGRGLVGIAERAGACGGSASCGPRSDARGFRVSVRLPAEGAMPAVGAR